MELERELDVVELELLSKASRGSPFPRLGRFG